MSITRARKNSCHTVGRGFTLLEAVFALGIFVMMGLLFAAVLPMTLLAARVSGHYAQAASLAQHKLMQIRGAGFQALQNPATLASLGVIDPGTSTSLGVPYTASFSASDHLIADSTGQGVFLQGTTATVTVTDYAALNAAVPAGTVDSVTVTLHWPAGAASAGGYSLSGLVIQMPHS